MDRLDDISLRGFIKGAPDAILIADPTSGEILDANSAAVELFGRSREELLGTTQTDLHPADDPHDYRALFDAHLAEQPATISEFDDGSPVYIETAEGTTVPVEINAWLIDSADQELVQGVFRDISDRLEYENELKELTFELEALNRLVRHDIRNDISIVLGWTEMLAEHVDPEGEPALSKIRSAGTHIVTLTENAGSYVETLSQGGDLETTTIRLDTVLEEEVSVSATAYPESSITLAVDSSPVHVVGNDLLSSVFYNLISNAVQHNDTDEPDITVSLTETDDTVVVAVADNGPGIPDEKKMTVFGKEIKRADSEGSGLGLYLVETLVGQCGGEVWIEDNEPRGAIFKVELPKASTSGGSTRAA